MSFLGIGLSREVKNWQSDFKQTLDAVEGRTSDQQLEMEHRLIQGLDALDRLSAGAAEKRKALADALVNHPKAIELVAKIRGVSDGAALLRNVKSGVPGAVQQAGAATAALQVIENRSDVNKKGLQIDGARALAGSANLADIKSLANGANAEILKKYIQLLASEGNRGASIFLGHGLYLTKRGIRHLDAQKNKLTWSLSEDHVKNVLSGDVRELIATRVKQISTGEINNFVRFV